MTKKKYCCPECGAGVTVWFDINAEVQYNVKPDGKLSKAVIVSGDSGEQRYGVQCQKCNWSIYGTDDDDEIDNYESLIKFAGKKADGIELTIRKGAKN